LSQACLGKVIAYLFKNGQKVPLFLPDVIRRVRILGVACVVAELPKLQL
jgi:hypothetical protein